MEINFKREANDSYLILDEKNSIKHNSYQEGEENTYQADFHFRMITENSIKGMLSVSRQNFNGRNQVYYQISGRQSLKELYEKKEMDRNEFMQLLRSLNNLLKTLNQYLLDSDYLLLTPEFIYLKSSSKEPEFCLYPFEKKDIKKQIRSLCEYFLNHIDHEDERVVSLAYQLYRLTREENFEFDEIIRELSICAETAENHTDDKRIECSIQENTTDNTATHTTATTTHRTTTTTTISPENVTEDMDDKCSQVMDKNCAAGEKIPVFQILAGCLTGGSFLSFLYIYFVKSYFYGYSPVQIMTAKETLIGLGLFLLLGAITLCYSAFSRMPRFLEHFSTGKKRWKFKK